MIEYSADGKTAVYDGYRFRKDPNTGYFLCTRKTDAGRRERLHVYVWRKAKGEIPEGFHVHHKDENKDNNEIENLACIPGSAHMSFHSNERVVNDYDRIIKNIQENVLPAACEWHKSEAGREWHKKHRSAKMDERVEMVCNYCGRRYLSAKRGNNRFCSNNCKSAYRRASGVDDVEKTCSKCGKPYIANKYQKTKYCKQCRLI